MPASASPVHPSETRATEAQTSPATPHLRAVRQRSLDALDEILQDKTQPTRERRLAAASLLRYAAAIETLELRLADRAAERAQRDEDPADGDESYEDDQLDDEDDQADQEEDADGGDDDFGPPPNPDDTVNMQPAPRVTAQSHPSHQSYQSHPSHPPHPPAHPTPNLAPRDLAHEAHLHQALRTARDLLNRQTHTSGLAAQPPP